MGASEYLVNPGDSLWKIAESQLGNPLRWKEIALLNQIQDPKMIFIGKSLRLPDRWDLPTKKLSSNNSVEYSGNACYPEFLGNYPASTSYGRAFLFIVADEINPFNPKLVRRVTVPTHILDPEVIRKIRYPEKYGFFARDPTSNVSPAGHVKGMTNSKYISLSDLPLGAKRHGNRIYWLDVKTLQKAGIPIIPHDELIELVEKAIQKEQALLDSRIAKGSSQKSINSLQDSVNKYKRSLQQAKWDKELLAAKDIPKELGAVKGVASMGLTRGLQVVGGLGIVFSARDIKNAAEESYQKQDIRILTRESTKQLTGWGGAALGASMAGTMGAAFSIETGPGAIAIGAIGSLVGGFVGFVWGAETVAKMVPESARSYILPEELQNATK